MNGQRDDKESCGCPIGISQEDNMLVIGIGDGDYGGEGGGNRGNKDVGGGTLERQ